MGPTLVERSYDNPRGWSSRSCDRFVWLFFRRFVHCVCFLLRDALGLSRGVCLEFSGWNQHIASSSSSWISCLKVAWRPSCFSENRRRHSPRPARLLVALDRCLQCHFGFFSTEIVCGSDVRHRGACCRLFQFPARTNDVKFDPVNLFDCRFHLLHPDLRLCEGYNREVDCRKGRGLLRDLKLDFCRARSRDLRDRYNRVAVIYPQCQLCIACRNRTGGLQENSWFLY